MSSSLVSVLSSTSISSSGSQSSTIIILIIIAVILTLRAYRGFKGVKFSKSAVYFRPVIYTILTIFSVLLISVSYIEILYVVIAIGAGCLIGLKIGGNVRFFEKDYLVYSKRSAIVMTLWLASYAARLAMGYLYPSNLYISLALDLLLASITGIIIGEAYHINDKYKKYIEKMTRKTK